MSRGRRDVLADLPVGGLHRTGRPPRQRHRGTSGRRPEDGGEALGSVDQAGADDEHVSAAFGAQFVETREHADVGDGQAHWLDELDPHVDAMGAEGTGEIGVVGTAATVSDAVPPATGGRVRELPVTLGALLPGLP